MGIRKYEPTTPSHRGTSVSDFIELTYSTPEKSPLVPRPRTGGRNNSGHIITRHIGGGYKQAYRIIDFKRYGKDGIPVKIARIEYDPNRTTHIVLLYYHDGEKHYIIAPNGLTQGTIVVSGPGSDIKPGNNPGLRQIFVDTTVHTVGLRPGGGTRLGRSAGTAIQLVARKGKYAILRIPSGEIRMVDAYCRATTSTVGNAEQLNINWGKTERNRRKGIRPTVHGVVIDPVDHPHGGGEGRTPGGRHLVSPQDRPEGCTRGKNKTGSCLIVCHHKTGKKR